MSLKPVTPRRGPASRGFRPAGMPVTPAKKESSSSGGIIVLILLIIALGGGYFVYSNDQKNEAALAAQKQREEENAQKLAEVERQRAEYEASKRKEAESARVTALGTATSSADSVATQDHTSDDSYDSYDTDEALTQEPSAEESDPGEASALGSTTIAQGSGEFAASDSTPPPFDLKATGKAGTKVREELDKAIDQAGDGDTFHDLRADLKRSFDVAYPELFADADTLPPFPDKDQKLLRLAQGVYVCLNLAAELDARDTVPAEQHAKFVNWLMKEKAKAARIFTFGLEHQGISDASAAADLLNELRTVYLKTPSSALKQIPVILKQGGK